MRILVTGGAGFIGSHVTEAYLAEGHDVAVLDNLSTGKVSNLPKGVTFFNVDTTDVEAVQKSIAEFAPDVVNHHAAQISVTHSVEAPQADAQCNIIGLINVLEAVRTVPGFQKFIYASSGGAMYGHATELPLPETTPAHPISPYGLSKYVAEQYVWLYSRLYGLNATVLRYSNVYGPRQDPHGEGGVCAIFPERMLHNQPVTIFGDGSATRDYIFVGDIAQANVAVLNQGDGEFFNICTGIETGTQQVYDVFSDLLGYTLPPTYADARPGEIERSSLDPHKAQIILRWQAQIAFADGARATVNWYKKSNV